MGCEAQLAYFHQLLGVF